MVRNEFFCDYRLELSQHTMITTIKKKLFLSISMNIQEPFIMKLRTLIYIEIIYANKGRSMITAMLLLMKSLNHERINLHVSQVLSDNYTW